MDSDYSKRRLAQKYFGVVDPDYYEWESHILFDDSHKETVLRVNVKNICAMLMQYICIMLRTQTRASRRW